ncbi:hypothetical protein PISL3812_03423 [Talaromyces islandicus]|uniref:Uncharacterized protein n=1 Tax=Talaromyces islandicus TaxID=28573 RepID=A0A0U1LSP5_TALIS|nr:hypothetical protein PISL3812_03423 [Talaromyces islandicus]
MRRERGAHEPQSPRKRSNTAPSFRARALLQDGNDNDQIEGEDEEEEEEDEETLQLQLAAIEAKLKLKRLQQSKSGRPATASSDGGDVRQRRPSSPTRPQSRLNAIRERLAASERSSDVQVPLSPSKKAAIPEPASPRRALFNFKKASEVSLKRPSSSRAGTRPTSSFSSGTRTSSAVSQNEHDSSDIWSPPIEDLKRTKSFSERIAESRNSDRAKQERAKRVEENRSSAFAIDKTEIERYKEEAAAKPQSTSPIKQHVTESFSREDVLQSYGGAYPSMKKSITAPVLRETSSAASLQLSGSRSKTTPHSRDGENTQETDQSKFEPFSSLNLSNRILPHSFLTRTLENKTVLRIPHLLKSVKAPEFELPESIDGDYVVFGIVASKSDPKQHKENKASTKEVNMYDDGLNNSEQYMVITLTDLKWTVDLFLFDTAFPRYYRLSEGMVIAILNPSIMPPPPNKIDSGRFSLCLSSSDDTVLEIGSARDIGYCKADRKDGKICRSWIDARKTEFCDFHVDVQIRRTQSQRAGVNAGTGMFAPGGRNAPRIANFGPSHNGGRGGRGNGPRGLKHEGAKYDWGTQSTYFVASAPKSSSARGGSSMYHRGGMGGGSSAASLIDSIDDNPFTGSNVRGNESKEERTRRRLLEDQRERDIAKKLGSRSGNTGSEYLRARLGQTATSSPASSAGPKEEAAAAAVATPFLSRKADSISLSPIRKRAHEDDKLSKGSGTSVKKTRFITSKGIREAGKDSICGLEARRAITSNNDDDDDDELDII